MLEFCRIQFEKTASKVNRFLGIFLLKFWPEGAEKEPGLGANSLLVNTESVSLFWLLNPESLITEAPPRLRRPGFSPVHGHPVD